MQDNQKRRKTQNRGLDEMAPKEIVEELDRYVVGQHSAKKAVAIALRNRIRRQQLDEEMAEEIAPKNIIMIGPTGVGKTEIARRLARLVRAVGRAIGCASLASLQGSSSGGCAGCAGGRVGRGSAFMPSRRRWAWWWRERTGCPRSR